MWTFEKWWMPVIFFSFNVFLIVLPSLLKLLIAAWYFNIWVHHIYYLFHSFWELGFCSFSLLTVPCWTFFHLNLIYSSDYKFMEAEFVESEGMKTLSLWSACSSEKCFKFISHQSCGEYLLFHILTQYRVLIIIHFSLHSLVDLLAMMKMFYICEMFYSYYGGH